MRRSIKLALLALCILLVWGYAPLRGLTSLLRAGVSQVASSAADTDTCSLRAALRNVTTDYQQLVTVLEDFFEKVDSPNHTLEHQFRQYLAHKASRSYPRLENWLDWLLTMYKVVFPFLVFSFVAKIAGGSGDSNGSPDVDAPPSPLRHARVGAAGSLGTPANAAAARSTALTKAASRGRSDRSALLAHS